MEPLLKYKKMSGFATTDGQQYEVNLAALLYLRGLNSGLDFQLGTNVDGAGALDDVVFRFKPSGAADTWTTLYVQLKFKVNRPIERSNLSDKKGNFSVSKYFDSYRKIKQAMSGPEKDILFDGDFEKSAFVIFTNAKVNEPFGKDCSETLSNAEEFVWCDSGNVFRFEEDEDILKCLGECGDDGKAFLGSFKMFCCQPDAKGLEATIEKELRKVDKNIINGVDFQSLFDCFLRRIKVWWEKSSEVLHKGNDLLRVSVLEVTSQKTEKDYNVALDFEEAVLESLLVSVNGDCKVVNVQSSESFCRLSLTKLCQAFGGQSLVLDCEGLLANQVALLAQWQKGDVKSLIICTNGWSSSHEVDYLSIVKDLLALRDTPPIVFVSNGESRAVGAIAGEFQESVKSYKDDFLFSQLTEKSQGVVLSSQVSLQGQSTTLREIMNGPPEEVDRVLHACSVVEILERAGNLTLGYAFGEGIDFYVDRHLELATVVKASVFQDGALRGNVTVRVTQCETSTDLGLETDRVGIPRVSATNNGTGLFEKAVSFLSSLDDTPSLRNVDTGEFVSNLSQSLMVADRSSPEVFIGPKFSLGLFECDSVGLRFGQQDAVTALRVRASGHSTQAGFLFVSDKTSENDVRKLSDFHQSKHLLSLEDCLLRWIQSDGPIESIRPHIDEKQVSTFSPENAMDVEDRLVLVCAEPGMGKSTLMARLAKNTKEAHPHHFVFLIALNDHSKLFAQDTHKDALGFLCSANKIESHLHRSLLKYALEVSGDVVVLLDGFDEIAPKYVEHSCALLTSLVEESKACKIWMTSRNSVKMTLEAKTLKFSWKLRKFVEVDQSNFLKRYWKAKSALSEIELDNFIKQLIAKTSQAVRDKERDFMGIPLQTRMLAEVYEDHVTGSKAKTKLPDKMDLLDLLEKFVDKKCSIYVQDKFKIEQSKVANYEELYEILKSVFVERHIKAALGLILDIDTIKSLRMESMLKENSKFFQKTEVGEDKTGFIDSIVDGKPRFVHRVFAEYFVATWIAKHFAENRDLVESKLFTADFSVVRNIFDRILAKDCALHIAVLNEDLDEVRTVLGGEEGVVAAKDGGGRTALHLAASLGISENREENKRRGEILDLLIVKTSDVDKVDDVLNISPLKYADVTRSWVAVDKLNPCPDNKAQLTRTLKDVAQHGMLETICDSDLHRLLGFCLDNGLEVEHCFEGKGSLLSRACELGSLKVASLLIKRNANIHAVDDKGQSPLHKATANGHIEVVKLLLRNVQTLENAPYQLTPILMPANCDGTTTLMLSARNDQQKGESYLLNNLDAKTDDRCQQVCNRRRKDYINVGDKDGWTAIYVAARKGHSDVISYLLNQGGDPLSRDQSNRIALHTAAYFKQPNAVRVLLEALDEADRADAVNSRDNYGQSVLMTGAQGGSVECVECIVKAGGMMTLVDDGGWTPLMAAAREGHQEVVSYLLDNFNAEREGITLQDYINMRNKDGYIAIDVSVYEGHSEVISHLVRKGGDPLNRDEFNRTPLHAAAYWKQPNLVRVLLDALDEADRADAVNSRDNDGDSVLMDGVRGGSLECVQVVVKAGGKMTQVNNEGWTPLMVAAWGGHQEVVSYLLNNFNAEREGITLQDYINIRNKDGYIAIDLAIWEGHLDVISHLVGKGGDPLSRNRDNSTPIHAAAFRKQPNTVRVLLEALDEADRATAVNSRDNDGDSVLMEGVRGGSVECVELIVKAGGMMTQVNNDRWTPLMFAAEKDHQEVVSYLLNNFNAERECITLEDYINMRNKDGETATCVATWKGNLNVICHLVNKGGDPLSRDEYNSTPLHLAARWKQPNAVRVLLEALDEADRADAVNSRDNNGYSVLMDGAWGGCLECVQLIVEAEGMMTQVNYDGRTPLMIASSQGHESVVAYLLSVFDPEKEQITKRAHINMVDKYGCTASVWATRGCSEMLQAFLANLVD